MSILKRFLLAAVLLIVAAVVLNLGYFWKQFRYEAKRLTKSETQTLPQEKMDPDTLAIPTLDIKAPIIYAFEEDENKFQEALQAGVVHYPATARPGGYGNVYIFGHSSDNAWSKGEYKTVFAVLPKIKAGDKVYVSDGQGNKYTYEIKETKIIPPDDLSVLDQGNYERRLLTLQTSYPVGTAYKRFVAIGEIVE